MIPGSVSKLAEQVISLTATVKQQADIVRVSSTATTTVLVTLTPAFGSGVSQKCWIVNSSGGAITATTAGNIATTVSIPNGNMCTFIFSKSSGKWHADKTT